MGIPVVAVIGIRSALQRKTPSEQTELQSGNRDFKPIAVWNSFDSITRFIVVVVHLTERVTPSLLWHPGCPT